MGDPAGIGGELVAKAVDILARKSTPVIIGDASVLNAAFQGNRPAPRRRVKPLGRAPAGLAEFVDLGLITKARFGQTDAPFGDAYYRYLMEALRLISAGTVDAVVTCPIN